MLLTNVDSDSREYIFGYFLKMFVHQFFLRYHSHCYLYTNPRKFPQLQLFLRRALPDGLVAMIRLLRHLLISCLSNSIVYNYEISALFVVNRLRCLLCIKLIVIKEHSYAAELTELDKMFTETSARSVNPSIDFYHVSGDTFETYLQTNGFWKTLLLFVLYVPNSARIL